MDWGEHHPDKSRAPLTAEDSEKERGSWWSTIWCSPPPHMPPINFHSCVRKAGWDTGSIWKNDETQTFIESVLRINRVFLRLSCRQLSSMQLWRSQKQADGEEFCFQMEEKPICRKKRQLVHLNRLQVAGRQKAKSWGARSGPGSVWLPTDQRNHWDNGVLPLLIRLACRRPAWLGQWRRRETAHRGPYRSGSRPWCLWNIKSRYFVVVQQRHDGLFYQRKKKIQEKTWGA